MAVSMRDVAALAGTHKLYLVFTAPNENSFDIDSVTFHAP